MKYISFKLLGVLIACFICVAVTKKQTKKLLVIGDSISIGYTPFLEKSLAPDILVTHNPGNGGSTVRGVASVEKWLDNRQWDVILFNFGLHDMMYKDSANKNDVVNGKVSVPLEEYRKNLETIVGILRETTAKLYFVTTTTVPQNSASRKVEDPARYNAVAQEVMKKNGIEVIDLYSASLTIHPQNSKPGNVHYTPEGYELLASYISKVIKAATR
ncbi:SGNH/GDSL hydrolase family protein [Lacibacter sp.]|uniref:SGNH/GDSL hydrolase family protein n=1 Tax=Lacibacter sp. TaxID=1915409 RepID=UPI002B4B03D1|nr:SGNH/GDSL hydrolase family protein [Lacibacter sp.]HLP36355.1 SGNH/GDSL hydrolase family protein [Lacibacter sp.]